MRKNTVAINAPANIRWHTPPWKISTQRKCEAHRRIEMGAANCPYRIDSDHNHQAGGDGGCCLGDPSVGPCVGDGAADGHEDE